MIPVTNLRNGACFAEDNNLYQVLNYEFVKLGRGTATIKLKTKNLRTGTTTDRTFISGARVQEAALEKKDVQYLYSNKQSGSGTTYAFMNPITFEQFELTSAKIGEQAVYLQEGMIVKIIFYQDEPLTIDLPIKMEFKIAETEPGYRGNSATNIFKDAILENGLKIKVPLFVNINDKVLVDTRNDEYVERVGK